jgi:hypothetical protein
MTAATDVRYCSEEDVRETLQESVASLNSGSLSIEFIDSAIFAESEWMQETTNRHWFDPDANDGVAAEPLTHKRDEKTIPSSPHADHMQTFRSGTMTRGVRYPTRFAGPYTRVKLFRRDVSELTQLLVRDQSGDFDDYLTDDSKTQGLGEDFYLQTNDSTGITHLYLDTESLPILSDYDNAVLASYEYGTRLTETVRTATACLAGAHLLRSEETKQAVPDDGQLVELDTKADELYSRGRRLLEIHL